MAHKFIHRYSELSESAIDSRINSMLSIREGLIESGVENLHIKISYGNRKTGVLVPSVSQIPVADCLNCGICRAGCYDARNDVRYPTVQKSRANNSALLRHDPDRYFLELKQVIERAALKFFRYHVGGDLLNRSHFLRVVDLATKCPGCQFLVFTKLYGVINHYLDAGGVIPENLHVIFSDWRGAKFDNRHSLPVSSPVWFDKNGAEIERGPHTTDKFVWCGGDCSMCAKSCAGCWGLKRGETVLFEAH